jgi:hypothetical protein
MRLISVTVTARKTAFIAITILSIIQRPMFCFKTRRFGDWILSPPSGGTGQLATSRLSCGTASCKDKAKPGTDEAPRHEDKRIGTWRCSSNIRNLSS